MRMIFKRVDQNSGNKLVFSRALKTKKLYFLKRLLHIIIIIISFSLVRFFVR